MSRLVEPINPGSVAFSARLTLKAHEDGRRCCLDCPGDGCRQWSWARQAMPSHTTPPTSTGRRRRPAQQRKRTA